MKRHHVVILMVFVAAASSAATLGIQKAMQVWGGEKIVVVTDSRCKECDTSRLMTSLQADFKDANIKTVDYSSPKGKQLYEKEGLKMLPAVLFSKKIAVKDTFKRYEKMAKPSKNYVALSAGGFDPKAEICDNGQDDNGDALIDCADATCKKDWRCMEKSEKPDVDVFVMSHCPYGLQIEKGLLPVWDLFGDKINLNIRYVGYAMHGKKEVDEQLKQYCVNEQGKQKFRDYLGCFVKNGEEGEKCDRVAKIDSPALASCIKKSDGQFGVTKAFEDKTRWQGQFPPFPIDDELAKKYNVSGSPTLVINGATAKTERNPKALRDAICMAFIEKPKECDAQIDGTNPTPGFGEGKAPAGGGQAKCDS